MRDILPDVQLDSSFTENSQGPLLPHPGLDVPQDRPELVASMDTST